MQTALGANLRRVRKARKMTQAALADRANVSRPTVSKIERGHRANSEIETVRKLAEALGVTSGRLLRPVRRSSRKAVNTN